MLLTLRFGVETSSSAYDTPKGLSIFGISVHKDYNKNAIAIQMQFMPETLVAHAFTLQGDRSRCSKDFQAMKLESSPEDFFEEVCRRE